MGEYGSENSGIYAAYHITIGWSADNIKGIMQRLYRQAMQTTILYILNLKH